MGESIGYFIGSGIPNLQWNVRARSFSNIHVYRYVSASNLGLE
jgi:hypothetical protein